MATPLVAQKTAANAGVIVNADQPADKRARVGSQFVGTPCRVVVLRNMVGPGEVDEDLEEEVRGHQELQEHTSQTYCSRCCTYILNGAPGHHG
jgi:hypothetical protein